MHISAIKFNGKASILLRGYNPNVNWFGILKMVHYVYDIEEQIFIKVGLKDLGSGDKVTQIYTGFEMFGVQLNENYRSEV